MVIYIVNQYATTTNDGFGGRHFYISKELAEQGHEVFLVTSSFTHLMHLPKKNNKNLTLIKENGINTVYLKTYRYDGSRSLKRILNWLLFSWKISRLYKSIKIKPDIIIVSSPSLFAFLGARSLAKKYNAKIFFDVRDIWPLTLIELGGFSKQNPLIRVMQWLEKKAYEDSDAVLSSIPYAFEHMEEKGMAPKKFLYLPNGIDKKELSRKIVIDKILGDQFPKNKFIIGYVGSLGLSNALIFLIKAAKLLNSNKSISFVIVGKGAEKKKLQSEVNLSKISNVTFIDYVPKEKVQSIIKKFDVCYIGWLKKQSYKFGVSPQKLPEYLFSGKPIIHSYSGKGCVVKEANAGISVPAEDCVAIKNAILNLKNMSEAKRKKLGDNGRKYSLKHFDYNAIVRKLETAFLNF